MSKPEKRKETEEERAARKERERREARREETEEERAARKERERREGRREETEEERAARKEREKREGRRETEEERAARKERERREGRREETEEERAARKERERREGKREETEEERAARKERERREGRREETEEERAARKEREKREGRRETEEERAARKERERREGRREETEEERAARKERERREGKREETEEERAARKERERREGKKEETPEEREARKARERAERAEKEEKERQKAEERARREVVHKPLPAAIGPPTEQKKASEPKTPVVEKQVVAAPPKSSPQAAPPAEDDDYGYDDDFEPAFAPEELAKATQAVAKENSAVKAVAAQSTTVKEPEIQGESRAGLDPNSLARQKHKKQYEQDLARATMLRRLVDLDVLTATLADLPPMSEYDLFIRNFGGAGREQRGCQAPQLEDLVNAETQAERIHSKTKVCQCPEDLGLFPERLSLANAAAATKPAGSKADDDEAPQQEEPTSPKRKNRVAVDTNALGSFMSRVFPVVRALLDENEATKNPLARKASFSNHSFSSTVVPLLFEPIAGRRVVEMRYSRLVTQYLLVVYGPPPPDADLDVEINRFEGVALLWNVNDPREPDKVLVSNTALTAGCLSVTRPHLIYAGSAAGSVCVWDTREPDHLHNTVHNRGKGAYTCRLPSFTSEWGKDNHSAPITRICISGYNSILGVRKEETEQLVSMDKRGQLYFWRVSESEQQNFSALSINEAEFGLNLFSAVRLNRATSVVVPVGDSGVRGGLVTNDLEFVPTDTSHMLVATGTSVLQLSRFGTLTAPSSYKSNSDWGTTTAATTVHYSPVDSRVFVTGYKDGNVRLYLKDEGNAQYSIPLSAHEIQKVRFSSSMKWVLFALDAAGSFFVLDFATNNKSTPVAKSELQEAKSGRCTAFDVSLEERMESKLGFGYEKGLVEVHTLNQKMFAPSNQRNDRWL
jgi:hypothetical protein